MKNLARTEQQQHKAQTQCGETNARTAESTRDKEFRESVERVYRVYGSDLPAFFRDVQREILHKRAG